MLARGPRLRDIVNTITPVWLRDRPGLDVGYRFLYGIAAALDGGIEWALQGALAGWPGVGTPTALPHIGYTRGLVQGVDETNAHYAERLLPWLETHADERTRQIAIQLHEYLPGNPVVRVIQRGRPSLGLDAQWITVAADGTITEDTAPWDWDSVSNPERANWWSEMWVVVYQTTYARRPGTLGGLPTSDDGYGLGLLIPHDVINQARAILASIKGAHSRVRAILFTTDATAYVPAGTGIQPNGTWGQWGLPGSDPYVAGGRDLTVTRYCEPSTTTEP